MYVPSSWGDITLGVYERFYNDDPKTTREKIDYVAKVCDTDPKLLLSWASEALAIIIDKIDFIYKLPDINPCPFVDIDGVRYTINTEDKLTLAQWVDIEEFQNKDAGDISSVLAALCLAPGEEYDPDKIAERADMFRAQSVTKVLPLIGFFLNYADVLEQYTRALLEVHQAAGLCRTLGSSFLKIGFGTILLTPLRAVRFGATMIYLRFLLARCSRTLSSGKTAKLPKTKTVNFGSL